MVAAKNSFDLLVLGDQLAEVSDRVRVALAPLAKDHLRFLTEYWQQVRKQSRRDVFVVSRLRDLANEHELTNAKRVSGGTKRFLLFLEDMPAESIPEYLLRLDIRSKNRVHLARLTGRDDEYSFLLRFVAALAASNQHETVVDAWWEGDRFVVLSPTFKRLRVPLEALPKLAKAKRKELQNFEIDPYGDFIYWPAHDIHMGWSQFEQAVNPQARLRVEQKNRKFNECYGRAIRTLRKSVKLSQRAIDGLNERTVRRIEQGKARATSNAIAKLARAHQMKPQEYMSVLAELLQR